MRPNTQDLTDTDMFCGAGGGTIAVLLGGGIVLVALNHSARCIETHATNFPDVNHALADVTTLDPRDFPRTDILTAGAECRAHTYARGKPRAYQEDPLFYLDDDEPIARDLEVRSRATMFEILRWAEVHDYEAIVVENVEEVQDWVYHDEWRRRARALGYRLQVCHLNSMFFGGEPERGGGLRPPQSRDRWWCVLTKEGNPAPDLDYRPRAWCPRCERNVDAVQVFKRPDGATRKAKYRFQYDYRCPEPGCGQVTMPWVAPAAVAIDWTLPATLIGERKEPLEEATLARIEAGLRRFGFLPELVPTERTSRDGQLEIKLPAPATEPMRTQTGRQETGFVIPPEPDAMAADSGVPFLAMLRRNATARRLDEPLPKFAASGQHHALIHPPVASPAGELDGETLPEALVVSNFNPGWSRPVTLPLGAFTARDHHALLVPCGGTWNDQAQLTCRPLPTQTSSETHALLLPTNGHVHDPGGTGRRCRLVAVEPMATQTADKEHALVQLPREFLVPYMRTGRPRRAATDPLGTLPASDRYALVDPAAVIDACGFRMLAPREIKRGMSFFDDYVITGNKREQVRQLGQAWTPPVGAWIFQQVADSLARSR